MIIEISNTNSNEKICTRCSCIKKKADFCRFRSNNPQHEYSTCNKCSEKCKNKCEKIQKEMDMITRKKTKLESNLNAPVPSISITLSQTNIDPEQADFSHPMNFELDDGFPKNHEDLNILQDDNDNEDDENENDNDDDDNDDDDDDSDGFEPPNEPLIHQHSTQSQISRKSHQD